MERTWAGNDTYRVTAIHEPETIDATSHGCCHTSSLRIANATAAVREGTFNLVRMWVTCEVTVRRLR
jgi:hypothetical protein